MKKLFYQHTAAPWMPIAAAARHRQLDFSAVLVFKRFTPPQCAAGAGDLRGGLKRRLTFSEAERSH